MDESGAAGRTILGRGYYRGIPTGIEATSGPWKRQIRALEKEGINYGILEWDDNNIISRCGICRLPRMDTCRLWLLFRH